MSLDPKISTGLGATAALLLAALALQQGFVPVPNAPLPDGGAVFPDGGYWGEVVVTGLNANTSCLNTTGWVNDGGTVPVRVTLLLNRQGADTWHLGRLPDAGPAWVWAMLEFQVYPAVLPDGGLDIAQAVNLPVPPGMWMNPDGVNNGDFIVEATPLYPQCQIAFVGYLGQPNSVPFACACAPRAGAGPGPFCVAAVPQPDGGIWNLGSPDITYGPGQWFPDAGCEEKPCFELAGVGPTSMPTDCWYPDGGF